MLRLIIEFIVPLLLPTLLWILIAYLRREQTQAVPWTWLAAAGVFLAFVVTWGGWLRADIVQGTYHPAHIGSGGHLQPGHVDSP